MRTVPRPIPALVLPLVALALLGCPVDPSAGGGADDLEDGFVRVEPGTFVMGSPQTEAGRSSGEVQHEVTLTQALHVQQTEVTQAEWAAVMDSTPAWNSTEGGSGLECPECPVERVSWVDALAYANRVSALAGLDPCYDLTACTGRPDGGCAELDDVACGSAFVCPTVGWDGVECEGYRLPTEAEWEYAARSGTETAFCSGHITDPDEQDPALDPIAWYAANSGGLTHGAATKTPTDWGLYDMQGNVAEWVWDADGVLPGTPALDPTGPGGGELRVVRGGSFDLPPGACRSAGRDATGRHSRDYEIGFRLVRAVH